MCEDCGIDNIQTEQSREVVIEPPPRWSDADIPPYLLSSLCRDWRPDPNPARACATAAGGQRPTSEDSLSERPGVNTLQSRVWVPGFAFWHLDCWLSVCIWTSYHPAHRRACLLGSGVYSSTCPLPSPPPPPHHPLLPGSSLPAPGLLPEAAGPGPCPSPVGGVRRWLPSGLPTDVNATSTLLDKLVTALSEVSAPYLSGRGKSPVHYLVSVTGK